MFNFNEYRLIALFFCLNSDCFTNISLTNPVENIFKLPQSNLNIISTRFYKHTNWLKIKGLKKLESFKLNKHRVNEAEQVYKKSLEFRLVNRSYKATKLLLHALKLDPSNPDILTELGELIEIQGSNIIMADYLCTKAILSEPTHNKAHECKKRIKPIVEELDQKRLNQIHSKVLQFYKIPENNSNLKQLKRKQHFSYIYHTTSIEGNSLSLAQTRFILETRLAIGGKSLMEQNEVMGVDLAFKYLNTLLTALNDRITLDDILEIHKRILGYVDISEAGHFRRNQVFIADHTPPPPEQIPSIMTQFIDWLNSDDAMELHPIELAALAHWKLVFIHPFSDGNGRLLMNLILMKANYPPSIIRTEDREQYFKFIKMANDVDVRPFIRFIAGCTERTLDDFFNAYADTSSVIASTKAVVMHNLSFYVTYS